MKIFFKTVLCLLLAGCGLSPDYWRNNLEKSSTVELCAASIDPRGGAGWQVRKRAANEMIQSRQIKCDYNLALQLLQVQAAQDLADDVTSTAMINNGLSIASRAQPTLAPPAMNTNCRRVGSTINCQSY
jgi:hypothetical protein